MKKRWLLLIPILFALDRAAKLWAGHVLMEKPGGAMDLIHGVVRLRYVENDGMAFSLFAGNSLLLVGLTGMIMLAAVLYLLFAKRQYALISIPLTMVLGGGLGNLYDRITYGSVIDYIEPLFVRFAVFNLADIFVVCGAFVCAFGVLRLDAKGDLR